jgi:hypothetical protein
MTWLGSHVTISGKTVTMAMHRIRQPKNGSEALAMVLLSLPAHVLQHEQVEAHRRRHLGDLHHQHDEACRTRSRSKPAFSTMGSTTAVVSTIIEMPSRKPCP